ncbi:MFS transporter [Pseudoxanthobacter sp.]|uniref:MFS transporter n=1 Tax=Pseudoxanthobacter sp. TaxID=1925742 RepID=UPI002FE1955B
MVKSRSASWTPFILVAMALGGGTMGATMASPLYPLYEQLWGIHSATVTVVYVVYMVAVMVAFLFLGRLSDHIDPVVVLRGALVVLLGGLALSAAAAGISDSRTGVAALGLGRILIGFASGTITTAATLGLLMLEPGGRGQASLVASITTMAGFGLGPLVCGLVAALAPMPLVTPYLAAMVLIAAILTGLSLLPDRRHRLAGRVSLRPRLGMPAGKVRAGFLVASFATFSAYALFSLLASLAPSLIETLLPWRGPAVSGTAVATVLFFSASVQFPARRLPPHRCLPFALAILVVGVVLLAAAVSGGSTVLFALAVVTIGTGHGLSFMSGLVLVNTISGSTDRAAILASYFSIAYLGTIVPILAVGFVADVIGLAAAIVAFCTVFAVFCVVLLALCRRTLSHTPA